MHTKILVAWNYESKMVDDLTIALVPIENWLKKNSHELWRENKCNTQNSDASSKSLKLELKNKLRHRRNVVEKSQSVEKVRRDRRPTL